MLYCAATALYSVRYRADVEMSSLFQKCWTSEFLAACTGLYRCNTFTHCDEIQDKARALLVCRDAARISHRPISRTVWLKSGQPIVMREFVVDLRKRLRGVWNADALAEHGEHTNKVAKHHHWMTLPLRPLSVHGAPFSVPNSIRLSVIGATKEDSKMKSILWKFPSTHRIYMDESGAFYYSQASSEDLEQLSRPSSQSTWLKSPLTKKHMCVRASSPGALEEEWPAVPCQFSIDLAKQEFGWHSRIRVISGRKLGPPANYRAVAVRHSINFTLSQYILPHSNNTVNCANYFKALRSLSTQSFWVWVGLSIYCPSPGSIKTRD
eukprot:1148376-Pelagomonas_calceolata.AAC.1